MSQILNDMIKVRAQVSDIALCLEDENPRMQDLARMFFGELAHKVRGSAAAPAPAAQAEPRLGLCYMPFRFYDTTPAFVTAHLAP